MSLAARLEACGGPGDGSPPEASTLATPRPAASGRSCPANWPPGLMLWFAPGVSPDDWRDPGDAPPRIKGYPVLLVDARPTECGDVLVTDGLDPFDAPPAELHTIPGLAVGAAAHAFTDAEASPSPRCASQSEAPPPTPAPLGWLSPAGLRCAGLAEFAVPGRALRHIIGRGGAR